MDNQPQSLSEQLGVWREKKNALHEKLKSTLQNYSHPPDQPTSYFSYSMQLTIEGDESFIIGNYTIYNNSPVTLNDPYICLKLSDDHPFYLSGKIIPKDQRKNSQITGGWKRMNEDDHPTEYWLSPMNTAKIEPFQRLSLQHFQLKWDSDTRFRGSMTGYTYSKEIPDGKLAINQIAIQCQ
ncbi:hypothetical protein [Halalkalibacillus halophilus]|uniref:hypothetical protein n=1 Tax=Halalkalibacillus halophilus TaxID=392827 RepID=UPI0003F7B181|nr:hypothetical protein [Halalkalibacillus halophilus]